MRTPPAAASLDQSHERPPSEAVVSAPGEAAVDVCGEVLDLGPPSAKRAGRDYRKPGQAASFYSLTPALLLQRSNVPGRHSAGKYQRRGFLQTQATTLNLPGGAPDRAAAIQDSGREARSCGAANCHGMRAVVQNARGACLLPVLNTVDVHTPRSDDKKADTPFVKALPGLEVRVVSSASQTWRGKKDSHDGEFATGIAGAHSEFMFNFPCARDR